MLSFGQRLKMLRREADISQSDLADALGVSVQSVSKWECDAYYPDVSMLLPLSSVLGVTADCLLGAGTNEKEDKEELDEEIEGLRSKYNIGGYEDNLHYKIYVAEKSFLKKYPLNYSVKLDCADVLYYYLYRSEVRGYYKIPKEEFETLWCDGVKSLKTLINQDRDPSRQIESRFKLIAYYNMKQMWNEAQEIAEELPNVFMIDMKSSALKNIADAQHDFERVCELDEYLSYQYMKLYIDKLWQRARGISIFGNARKKEAIRAWGDFTNTAKLALDIFGKKSWEYYAKTSSYIADGLQMTASDCLPLDDIPAALDCCEKIVEIAEDVLSKYDGSSETFKTKLIKSFKHQLRSCYSWVFDTDDNILTREERYKACKARLDALE